MFISWNIITQKTEQKLYLVIEVNEDSYREDFHPPSVQTSQPHRYKPTPHSLYTRQDSNQKRQDTIQRH